MKITSFNIYEFGNLAKQEIHNLPNGLLIFLGQNEAGKSTTLEFFRTLLTGFPAPRSKKAREGLFSLKNPQMGGMLELKTNAHTQFKLERTRNAFHLFSSEGQELSPSIYESLLAGTNREIYSSLYGFNLSELQNLNSLEEEDVKSVLYGTSFGLGFYSPQKALLHIENALNSKGSKSLVKNESIKNKFKLLGQRLEEVNQLIKEYTEKNNSIENYYDTKATLTDKIDDIKNLKQISTQEIQFLQKKIESWQLYEEYSLLKQQISRIEPISPNFPTNAEEIINKYTNDDYQLQKDEKNLLFKKDQLLDILSKKEHNALLVEELLLIKQLVEYKGSYRNSFIQKPYVLDALEKNEEEVNKLIKYLGDGWSAEKIASINFSLETQKLIDNYARILEKEQNDINESKVQIQHLEQEKILVLDDIMQYEEQVSQLIIKEQQLSLSTRNSLQNTLRLSQDAFVNLPQKHIQLSRATKEFSRSITQLSFKITASEELLEKLIDNQESFTSQASTIIEEEKLALNNKNSFTQAKKDYDKLEEKYDNLIKENQKHIHLQKSSIQKKKYSLQRMKSLLHMQIEDEDRLLDLQAQYDEIFTQLPIKTSNIIILLLGFCSLCIGTVLLISGLVYGIKEFDISFVANNSFIIENFSQYFAFPEVYINHSPFAFLLFLLGFTSIYLNIPLYSPDRKKKLQSLAQISTRKDSLLAKLQKNQEEFHRHLQALHIKDTENIEENISCLELELDEEQELLFTKEKLLKETSSMENELEQAKITMLQEHEKYMKSEDIVQDLRYEWQESFMKLSISDVPSPQAADAYFARIEKIRLAKENLTQLEIEIEQLKQLDTILLDQASQIFPKLDFNTLYTSNKEKFFEKIQELLDEEYANDKLIERKLQIEENIQNLRNKIQFINQSIENKNNIFSKLELEHEETLLKWKNFLTSENFDKDLTPHTAKDFINHIEKCKASLQKSIELQKDLDLHKSELERLEEPMKILLSKLSRLPILRLDNEPDYLASLDLLYTEAEKAKETLNAKTSLEEQLEQIDYEISHLKGEKEKLKNSINDILEKAHIASFEDLKNETKKYYEYNSLLKKKQNLEDTLTFAASTQGLESFLNEFIGIDLAELMRLKQNANEKLLSIIQEEEIVARELLQCQNTIQEIESSNILSELRQEKSSLEEESSKLLENYLAYALAKSCIQNAKKKYEEEKQPELIKTASEIFSDITYGKWENITSSIEDNTLKINQKNHPPVTPDMLSQGTKEQLYLSLRLAYIKNAAKHKESLPLIMDDILVNFDTIRSSQTAKSLAKLIEESQNTQNPNDLVYDQQILFFTCHPHIATILKENVPQSTLYTINNGKIALSA